MKKRLFSGIQPSGDIHLGNYLGAIRNWVRLQDEYECIYCVVDYHAITIDYDTATMQEKIVNAAADLLACGLDPEKCILFKQSDVIEHTELAWILSSVTPMGDLERMTQFKDKSKQHKKNINSGLFTYPVLQAADIILYKAEIVPVGEDQIQHIELSREIARKFNNKYGDVFPEPQHIVPNVGRIRGLDGKAKMSKSMNNYIALIEDESTLWEKLRTAMTDPARKRRADPGNPWICNVFTLHRYFSSPQEIDFVEKECKSAGIGCIDCKKILFKNMNEFMKPLREKKQSLDEDPEYVYRVLDEGKTSCSGEARETIREVRQKLGLIS